MSAASSSQAAAAMASEDRAPASIGGGHTDSTRADLEHKVVAAVMGSCITNLTMTPFDVIKTRLQSQPPPEPLFVPSSRLPPPSPAQARGKAAAPEAPIASTSKSGSMPSAASKSAANAATCCQKTYFTANASDEALLCRYDPRADSLTRAPPSTSSVEALASSSRETATAAAAASRRGGTKNAQEFVRAFEPRSMEPLLAATGGRGGTIACVYPDAATAALELPAHSGSPSSRHLSGMWDAVTKIIRHEGVGTLWRGTAPALAISVPGQVIYMVGFDSLRRSMLAHPPSWATTDSPTAHSNGHERLRPAYITGVPLLAGGLSRTAVAVIMSPIELLRTRLQSTTGPATTFMSVVRSLRETHDVRSLWRGLPATLWRDVPFSAVYWAGYEGIKRSLTGGRGMGEAAEGQGAWREFATAFASGAGSGMIAATLTNPFDVIKTRRQASLHDARSGAAAPSTMEVLVHVAKNEGLPGLLSGLTPRLAKVGPACGIMIGVYEVSRYAWRPTSPAPSS